MADFHPIEWAKEHPGVVIGGGIVVIIGGIVLLSSGGSSSSSSGGQSSADYQAALAASASEQNTATAAAAQSAQTQASLTAGEDQIAGTLALAQENNSAAITEAKIAAGVTNNSNTDATAVQELNLNDELAGLINNNDTTLGVSTIQANENTTIAATNAGVQKLIANDQYKLGVVQSNNVAQEQEDISNNAANASIFGGLFSIIGKVL